MLIEIEDNMLEGSECQLMRKSQSLNIDLRGISEDRVLLIQDIQNRTTEEYSDDTQIQITRKLIEFEIIRSQNTSKRL